LALYSQLMTKPSYGDCDPTHASPLPKATSKKEQAARWSAHPRRHQLFIIFSPMLLRHNVITDHLQGANNVITDHLEVPKGGKMEGKKRKSPCFAEQA